MSNNDNAALLAELQKVKDEHDRWATLGDPPEPPEWMSRRDALWETRWRPPSEDARRERIGVRREALDPDDVRERVLPEAIARYMGAPDGEVLLLKVPPGVGKSHGTALAMEQYAREGHQIAFFVPSHGFWDESLSNLPIDDELWYRWLPIHESQGEGDPLPTTCEYHGAMMAWLRHGAESRQLCRRICMQPEGPDGYPNYMHRCRYRTQHDVATEIVVAQHPHLFLGGIPRPYAGVLEEYPMSLAIGSRFVPQGGIMVDGAKGPVLKLMAALLFLSLSTDRPLSGRELFDARPVSPAGREMETFGLIAHECLAESFPALVDALPYLPDVMDPQDVYEMDYFYILDVLKLLAREMHAWASEWERWLGRVVVTSDGVRIHTRRPVWSGMPQRMIVLDATGSASLYEELLERRVRTEEIFVRRTGRVYQIAEAYNGITGIVDKQGEPTLTNKGEQLREFVRHVVATREGQRVGVVTFKDVVPQFEEIVGEGNVLHFYAARGMNSFMGFDVVIVVGCPAPSMDDTIQEAMLVYRDRLESFLDEDEHGNVRPIWVPEEVEYPLTRDAERPGGVDGGAHPYRNVMQYADEALRVVFEQKRERELLQAAGRGRYTVQDVEVIVLTTTPLGTPVDGWWDSIEEYLGTPDGIGWRHWLKLTPRLEEWARRGVRVTVPMLAAAAGVSESTVYRNKWMEHILEQFDEWQVTEIATGGRPRQAIQMRGA